MNRLPAVVALLLTTLPIAAQTKILVAKSRVQVAVAGDYRGGIAFPTACDAQGRLYVKLIEIGPGMVGPIFRLSNEGGVEAQFDTSGALINRYAVRPDGGVIMLHSDGSTKFIDNFAPDGVRESSIGLDRPPTPFSRRSSLSSPQARSSFPGCNITQVTRQRLRSTNQRAVS